MAGRRRQDGLAANDHDLLIEIKTKLEALNTSVTQSAVDVQARLSTLSEGKAEASQVADHERRIRGLESRVWMAVGAIAFFEILALALSMAAFLRQ